MDDATTTAGETPKKLYHRAKGRVPKLQFFRDAAGGHRYRIIGGNGEIVASSEAYTRRVDARRGFDTLAQIVARVASTTRSPDE